MTSGTILSTTIKELHICNAEQSCAKARVINGIISYRTPYTPLYTAHCEQH